MKLKYSAPPEGNPPSENMAGATSNHSARKAGSLAELAWWGSLGIVVVGLALLMVR